MYRKQLNWSDTPWRIVANRALASLTAKQRAERRQQENLDYRMALATLSSGVPTTNEKALLDAATWVGAKAHDAYKALDALEQYSGGLVNVSHLRDQLRTRLRQLGQRPDPDNFDGPAFGPNGRMRLNLKASVRWRAAFRAEALLEQAIQRANFKHPKNRSLANHVGARAKETQGAIICPVCKATGWPEVIDRREKRDCPTCLSTALPRPVTPVDVIRNTDNSYTIYVGPKFALLAEKNDLHIFGDRTLVLHIDRTEPIPQYHVVVGARGKDLKLVIGALSRRRDGSPYLRILQTLY